MTRSRPRPDLRVRDDDVVYDAGRQLTKVRLLLWFFVLTAAGAAWAAVSMLRDGPTLEQYAWAAFVAAAAAACLGGMWVYTRHYVAEVRDVGGSHLLFRFPGFIGTTERRYRRVDVRFDARRAGRAQALSFDDGWAHSGITVNAPWIPVRVPDRRWPLIMDAQGWFRSR